MVRNNIYSEQEIKLFNSLGYKDFNKEVEPIVFYRMVLLELFCDNKTGPDVDAFRRGYISCFRDSKIYRKTKEYDDLISF